MYTQINYFHGIKLQTYDMGESVILFKINNQYICIIDIEYSIDRPMYNRRFCAVNNKNWPNKVYTGQRNGCSLFLIWYRSSTLAYCILFLYFYIFIMWEEYKNVCCFTWYTSLPHTYIYLRHNGIERMHRFVFCFLKSLVKQRHRRRLLWLKTHSKRAKKKHDNTHSTESKRQQQQNAAIRSFSFRS